MIFLGISIAQVPDAAIGIPYTDVTLSSMLLPRMLQASIIVFIAGALYFAVARIDLVIADPTLPARALPATGRGAG